MNGTLLNIAAYPVHYTCGMRPAGSKTSWPAWVVEVSQAEMLDAFTNFGREAHTMLEHIDKPSKWTIHGLYPPLNSFVGAIPEESLTEDEDGSERKDDTIVNVALVGDAAHAMLPYLGAGAGAGIEDAYLLVSLLTHPQACSANISVRLDYRHHMPVN